MGLGRPRVAQDHPRYQTSKHTHKHTLMGHNVSDTICLTVKLCTPRCPYAFSPSPAGFSSLHSFMYSSHTQKSPDTHTHTHTHTHTLESQLNYSYNPTAFNERCSLLQLQSVSSFSTFLSCFNPLLLYFLTFPSLTCTVFTCTSLFSLSLLTAVSIFSEIKRTAWMDAASPRFLCHLCEC